MPAVAVSFRRIRGQAGTAPRSSIFNDLEASLSGPLTLHYTLCTIWSIWLGTKWVDAGQKCKIFILTVFVMIGLP